MDYVVREEVDRRQVIRRENDIERIQNYKNNIERITLTRLSLLMADYGNRHDNSVIRRFMNRLLAMTQDGESHRIILVLDQSSENQDYRLLYHTMHDHLWKETFESILLRRKTTYLSSGCKKKPGENHIFFQHDRYHDYACPFFQNIYLIFMEAFFIDKNDSSKETFRCRFIKKKKLNIQFSLPTLLDELQNQDSTLYEIYSPDVLKRKLNKRQEKWDNGHYETPCPDPSYEKLPDNCITEWEQNYRTNNGALSQNFYDYHLKEVEKIINAEYIKICRSSFLWNETFNVSNIFFSVRMFSRDSKRFPTANNKNGTYPYDVYTIIPEQQYSHLSSALSRLTKRSHKGKRFKGRDDFFWREIKSLKGRKKILSETQTRWGDYARALSDMTYNGGFVRLAMHTFPENSANRLGNNIWEKAQDKELSDKILREDPEFLDYRRIVYHHYIMSLATPHATDAKLFLIPSMIGGSPWCCMAFLLHAQNNDLHQTWVNGYIIYHDIYKQVIHNIGSEVTTLYMDELRNLYYEILLYAFDNKESFDASDFIYQFNLRTKYLCRIYPFQQVILKKNPNTDKKNPRELDFIINLNDNPYFSKSTDYAFLDCSKIKNHFAGIPDPYRERIQMIAQQNEDFRSLLENLSKDTPH